MNNTHNKNKNNCKQTGANNLKVKPGNMAYCIHNIMILRLPMYPIHVYLYINFDT